MTVNLKEKREINKFLELLAFSSIKKFHPTAVLKYTNISSLENLYDYFLDLVESGELYIKWEVKCTNEDIICARTIEVVATRKEVLNKDVMCDICGHEFTVTPLDLFPVFEVTNDFRELVRDDFKKKATNRLKIKVY